MIVANLVEEISLGVVGAELEYLLFDRLNDCSVSSRLAGRRWHGSK
jgi:hypothetical protein